MVVRIGKSSGLAGLRRKLQWLIMAVLAFPLLAPVPCLSSDPLDGNGAVVSATKMDRQLQAGLHRLIEWQGLLEGLQGRHSSEQMQMVNDFFNARVRYESDVLTWGVEDYWATPEELLMKGRGDCEDIAIAKYVSLRALGMAEESLRLAYVLHRNPATPHGVRAHVVLTHDPSGAWQRRSARWVLDNLTNQVVHSSTRADLQEVLLFNRADVIVSQTGMRFASREFSRWARFLERFDSTLRMSSP